MTPNELFAAGIADARTRYIDDATAEVAAHVAAHDAGWSALDVQEGRRVAGQRWDYDHPQYARTEEAA